MVDDIGWQPGLLARIRALLRRALVAVLGARGEDLLHGLYLRLLRAAGRFGPPEDATTMSVLSAIARRSNTLLDVGANVGRYAWYLRRQAGPRARLYALEPHPGAAKLLRAALVRRPGCVVLEVAAAERDGSAQLVVPRGAFGSPVSGLAWVQRERQADPAGVPIHLCRLDGLVDDGTVSVTGPVFMKIDVEGGEAGVLRGAADLLKRHRPILYFECQAASLTRQGETAEGVWAELGEAGYRMFANRAGRFVRLPAVDPAIVNYLGIPDLGGSEVDALDAPRLDAILDAWATRTRQETEVAS